MSLAQVKRTTSKHMLRRCFFFAAVFISKCILFPQEKWHLLKKCLFFIQASMVNFNGKPYLRIKIRLRVIVWWPFCDFFFYKSFPCPGKTDIGETRRPRIFFTYFVKTSWKHQNHQFPIRNRAIWRFGPFCLLWPSGPKSDPNSSQDALLPSGGPFLAHHGPKWCFFLS